MSDEERLDSVDDGSMDHPDDQSDRELKGCTDEDQCHRRQDMVTVERAFEQLDRDVAGHLEREHRGETDSVVAANPTDRPDDQGKHCSDDQEWKLFLPTVAGAVQQRIFSCTTDETVGDLVRAEEPEKPERSGGETAEHFSHCARPYGSRQ